MAYTVNQITDFQSTKKTTYNGLTSQNVQGGNVNEIFDKQKKLRELLVELLQTCYSDIQKTADQRRKELKKFNDKYLLDTIKDALDSRDITSIESGIEDIIIENFSNLNVIDQAKLKSYVLDTLKKHKEEQTEKNSEDSERYSRTEKHGVTFKKDVSPLSLFKDTLGNEKIMRGVIDRIGCRIISTQHTLNKNTLKSVKEGISGVKIQDVKYEKNDIKKEAVKEKDTSENSLLKEKIKRLDGIISGQIDNFNSSTSLFSIFDSSRRYRKYGFVKQRLRNIKALKTKVKRKIGFKINGVLGSKNEKKTLKKRFLEQYNDITLRKLYNRISEFDKATILSKPKKKSILLTLGYGVKTFVTWAVKGIFGVIKTTIKGIWNVTKKIFGLIKTGVTSLLSRIKIFLMTPAGAYIVGFVAGLVWFKLIKPVVDWVKDKIKKLLKLMGYESLDELKADKDKILKDLRTKYSNFINNNGIGIRQADKFLGDMELLAAKLDNFEAKIQTFKENTTGKAINTACTTVGIIVGSFFGPIGGLVGGALGKAVGMTAEYFYKQIPDKTDESVEKNLILRRIRERYDSKGSVNRSKAESNRIIQLEKKRTEEYNIKNDIKDIDDSLSDKNLSKEQRDKLQSSRMELEQKLQEVQNQRIGLEELGHEGLDENEEQWMDVIRDMYGYISKDANYFNLENLNFNYDFGDGIKKQKSTNGDDIKQLIHDVKKQAFLQAYNLVLKGIIPPSKCKETAEDILNDILDASRKQVFGSHFTLRDVINGKDHRETNYDEWIKEDEQSIKIKYDNTFKDLEKNRENIRKLLKVKGFDDLQIEDILNSNYVKWKLMDIMKTGGDITSLTNELAVKYSTLIPSQNDQSSTDQKDFTSVGDGKTEAKLGVFSATLGIMGTILNLTESDVEKRKELNKANDAALQRYAALQYENEKEDDDITKKAQEEVKRHKDMLRREITTLEKVKENLKKLQDQENAWFITQEDEDIETNPNAENEGKDTVSIEESMSKQFKW